MTVGKETRIVSCQMANQPTFDFAKLRDDLAERGWLAADLARAARVSEMTVSRVLAGKRHNPRTIEKLAKALGRTLRRYLIRQAAA